jgi:CBS-domain-containing membrane protein
MFEWVELTGLDLSAMLLVVEVDVLIERKHQFVVADVMWRRVEAAAADDGVHNLLSVTDGRELLGGAYRMSDD